MRRVALLLLALGACRQQPEEAPRATLRVETIGTLDSGPALYGPAAVLAQSTQATLVGLNAKGEVVPGLATSWRFSDDGLSVIFRLRDARWPDGRAMSAGDVVAVYRRLLGPETRHPLAGMLGGIVGMPEIGARARSVKALGVNDPLPNIVEIRLTGPQPELLQLLASPSMAIVRRGSPPPAGGPFATAALKERPLVLKRSSSYFDAGAVPAGRIALMPEADPHAAIVRFQGGKADVVIGGGLAGAAEAEKLGAAWRVDPSWSTYAYVANIRSGPLADRRVRRALAMVVDRDALAQRLPGSLRAAPLTGLTPAGMPSNPEPARPDWSDWLPEARLAEAQRLLAEAGFGPDKPLSVEILLPEGEEHRALLAGVTESWASLGVQTVAIQKDAPGLAAAVRQGRYQLVLAERTAPADTPLFFLDPYRCRGPAPCNREAESLLAGARVSADAVQRSQSIRKAEQLIVDDTRQISLLIVPRWSLVSPRVSGWSPNALAAHPLAALDMLPTR